MTFAERVFRLEGRERVPVVLAALFAFCTLFSYYLLRPVRDEISSADRGNLQLLWTAVFLVMLVAVPLYSAAVSRWSRAAFIPWANRCFALNLLAFYAALVLLPETARPWIDRVFYVWSSVFALFIVTVFWGFIADLFRNEQGRRVFGLIAVGASLGGITGSAGTAFLAERVPVFALLLLATLPLEAAARLAGVLHRHSGQAGSALRVEREPRVGGTAWSGIVAVFRSAYLSRIALYFVLMTFCSTILYYEQAHLLGAALANRAARTTYLARIDLAVNGLTLLAQGVLTAQLIRAIGLGVTLAVLPAVAALGFLGLGASPALAALAVVQVLYRSSQHGVSKPAREVLFTLLARDERYKSKAFIDTAVYRGGDLVSAWAYAGLAAAGLSVAAIALVSAPVAAGWAVVALLLGRDESERRRTAGANGDGD